MIANGFISMGGDEIDDLSSVSDPEEIRRRLTESMIERTPSAIGLFVGYWRRFLWEARNGDIIVLPVLDRSLAIGTFVGRYYFVPAAVPRARHRRAISWDALGVPRDEFDIDLLRTINGRHTIQAFKSAEAADRIRRAAGL